MMYESCGTIVELPGRVLGMFDGAKPYVDTPDVHPTTITRLRG